MKIVSLAAATAKIGVYLYVNSSLLFAITFLFQ